MKSQFLLSKILCLLALFTVTNEAVIAATFDKTSFADRVKVSTRDVLQKETQTLLPPLSLSRINLIGEAIEKSSMKELNENSATWLEQSFINYAKAIHLKGFAEATKGRDEEFKEILKVITSRLTNLDDVKVHAWMEQSQVMEVKAEKYNQLFEAAVISKLSTAKYYKVNLGDGVGGFYLGSFSMLGIVGALGYRLDSTSISDSTTSNTIDLRSNNIDSKILCLSLIRVVNSKFREDVVFNDFSYGNIFSAAFEDGDPYGAMKEKTFEEVSEVAMRILNENIQVEGEVTTIDWRGLLTALQKITEMRVQDDLKAKDFSERKNKQYSYVIFGNQRDLWNYTK